MNIVKGMPKVYRCIYVYFIPIRLTVSESVLNIIEIKKYIVHTLNL